MFRIKINNKFWNFEDGDLTSIESEKILTSSALEADTVADFLKSILPNRKVKVEIVDDNCI